MWNLHNLVSLERRACSNVGNMMCKSCSHRDKAAWLHPCCECPQLEDDISELRIVELLLPYMPEELAKLKTREILKIIEYEND